MQIRVAINTLKDSKSQSSPPCQIIENSVELTISYLSQVVRL